MRANNNIVVDLSKVQYSVFNYVNEYGMTRLHKPKLPTFLGHTITSDIPDSLRYKLDRWQPQLKLQLTANHSVVYTGDKAVEMYKAWRGRIFGKK